MSMNITSLHGIAFRKMVLAKESTAVAMKGNCIGANKPERTKLHLLKL
jgi:hypothetical protein